MTLLLGRASYTSRSAPGCVAQALLSIRDHPPFGVSDEQTTWFDSVAILTPHFG